MTDLSPAERLNTAKDVADELVAAWGSWGPTMSPDGSAIAFISDRFGIPALQVQQGDRDPVRIDVGPDPVVAVHWSADGAWLGVAVATNGGVRQQVWVVRPDGRDLRRVAGSANQHAAMGPWTRTGHQLVVSLPEPAAATQDVPDDVTAEQTRVLLIQPATGVGTRLAVGDLLTVLDLSDDERFVLLRDGTRGANFCVMVDRRTDQDFPLLAYPRAGSTEIGLLRHAPPGSELPEIAYLVTDAGLPRRVLLAQPVGADGRRGEAGVLAARDDAELEFLDSDERGRLLLLGWNVSGASELEILDTHTGRRRPLPVPPAPVVAGCAISRDGSRVVVSLEGPQLSRELWTATTTEIMAGGTHRLTPRVRTSLTRSDALVEPTLESFGAHDGLDLTGWLYRPRAAEGPRPTVLWFHGGPEAQERPTFAPQHQAMVAAGFAVFAPNVRGSSGFGRAFVHADDRNGRWSGIDDALTCARYVIDRGIADPARVAITGRSYGGYLTLAALVRFPGVFAAGVDVCGMSDLLTFYRDTEPWIAAAAVTKYGDPIHDRELLADLSPLARAERIDAPLLVVHGELDTNVPVGESVQIVAALRALGRPVEFLPVPGEGHEYRRVDSRRLVVHRMLEFLGQHLLD